MYKHGLFVTTLVLTMPAAYAGTAKGLESDLVFGGGASGGYFYGFNTGSTNNDDMYLSDLVLEVSAEQKPSPGPGASVNAGVGTFTNMNVFNGGVNLGQPTPVPFDILYGWVNIMPMNGLGLEIGQLATKIGYETAPSFANANILRGALWAAEPVYYPGLRANWGSLPGGVNVFVEANNDKSTGATSNYVAGVNGTIAPVKYSVAYSFGDDGTDIANVIVGMNLINLDWTLNADVLMLEDAINGDDTAWGIAVYVAPKIMGVSVPVRGEFFSEGNTLLYSSAAASSPNINIGTGAGIDSGWSVTVTPTWNFANSAFVRAEVAWVQSDSSVFVDSEGRAEDNNTSFALQGGFRF